MVKDPATGKRVSRPNPNDQYRSADAPHLRIVDDATWSAAQALKQRRRRAHTVRQDRGPRRFLSGLLRCGSCGSTMISVGRDKGGHRLQCASFRESGTCKNGRRIKRDAIEREVLRALEAELSDPVYLAEFVKTYNAEFRNLAKQRDRERTRLEARIGQIGRELCRAIDLVLKNGADPAAVAPRINELERERSEAGTKLAGMQENKMVSLHPATVEKYRQDVQRLSALLTDKCDVENSPELVDAVRSRIEQVIVFAKPNSTDFEVEIRGRLGELVGAPIYPSGTRGVYVGSGGALPTFPTSFN